jgi:hypothetical protein
MTTEADRVRLAIDGSKRELEGALTPDAWLTGDPSRAEGVATIVGTSSLESILLDGDQRNSFRGAGFPRVAEAIDHDEVYGISSEVAPCP